MNDISEYAEDLTAVEEINLRKHLSKAYELCENLKWCDPDTNLEIHRRTITEKDGEESKDAAVPIISATFNKHNVAQNAYTELQHSTNEINIDVYDVHYKKDEQSIIVVLEPFELN